MAKLQLRVVSQERELLNETVDSLTAQTVTGEITILPNHIPLFTKLDTGELVYRHDKQVNSVVVSRGFLTVSPNNEVTVMADSAVYAREISEEKAQEAIQAAHETLRMSVDQRERVLAEASLRRALLEIRIAERSRKNRI
ncbi:ATP synthase F1 subunit epsilon [Candidatus Woesebacteria bacterium]|nr:ATP synthase F1 subunit epsilon [Candidatus Woesebacteria bacterium]